MLRQIHRLDRPQVVPLLSLQPGACNLLTLRAKVGIGLPAPEYYKVEENRLRRLNAKKQPITGELADQYVLTK
jgi:hypothetical protein